MNESTILPERCGCDSDLGPGYIAALIGAESGSCLAFLRHACHDEQLQVCKPCFAKLKQVLDKAESRMDRVAVILIQLQGLRDRNIISLQTLENVVSDLLPEYLITGTEAAKEVMKKDYEDLPCKQCVRR